MTTITLPSEFTTPAFNAPVPNWSARGIGADATAAERMAFLRAAAERVGLDLPETRLPEGTALLPEGTARLGALRQTVEAMPTVGEALDALTALEASEAALDVRVPLASVRMDEATGGLYGLARADSRGAGLAYNRQALGHLLSLLDAPRGALGALETLPEAIRARAFNFWAERSGRGNDAPVVLRTYKPMGGRRVARAVVTEAYAPVPDSAILRAILDVAPRDARLDMARNSRSTSFELILPMMNRPIVVGDTLMARARISNSQDKSRSVDADAGVLRVLCYNLTTAWSQDRDAVVMRHVGDARDMMRRLRATVRQKLDQIAPFVVAFGDSYADMANARTPAEIVGRAVKARALPAATAEVVVRAWGADGAQGAPALSRGAYVNAVTRAAKDQPADVAERLEAYAGRVVAEGWGALTAVA